MIDPVTRIAQANPVTPGAERTDAELLEAERIRHRVLGSLSAPRVRHRRHRRRFLAAATVFAAVLTTGTAFAVDKLVVQTSTPSQPLNQCAEYARGHNIPINTPAALQAACRPDGTVAPSANPGTLPQNPTPPPPPGAGNTAP